MMKKEIKITGPPKKHLELIDRLYFTDEEIFLVHDMEQAVIKKDKDGKFWVKFMSSNSPPYKTDSSNRIVYEAINDTKEVSKKFWEKYTKPP